ncbi:2OG-Fe dioxygenase family protein [Vibrio sp. RE86]|uniref:2OG-Fe dioxygenase family protein n=1 Tax=Vibrio sp. RE86 TaxID=2607605 RepID=UPI001493CC6F|nr:2OG-Fe dioxygenase family protein [Vibrio sp. RE86]NOH78250.1 2OG-Fe dioxygenase family protein [Vibrio sp. RE86]
MDTVKSPLQRHSSVIARLLADNHYVFISGKQMTNLLSTNVDEVIRFKNCWNHLERDRYMADGGAYRYRRYGQFNKLKSGHQITMLPHEPYVQPAYINHLNGDIERHFEPLTDRFVTSPVLEKLLLLMSDIYDGVEGQKTNWNIRLHPYRIIADGVEEGQPTPEGLHRDGVTFIASLMINKSNAQGGETTITDSEQNVLERITLDKTFDVVLANDEQTMHEVSAIAPDELDRYAYRDVLVIAFTKMEE